MKTYLGDNLELADKDVLRRVGVDAGLDAKAIDELLASNAFEDTVIAEEKEAAKYGINTVPFFVVGTYGFSGAQSADYMKEIITKVLEEENK